MRSAAYFDRSRSQTCKDFADRPLPVQLKRSRWVDLAQTEELEVEVGAGATAVREIPQESPTEAG